MATSTITNLTNSVLDLAPVKDINDRSITLKPAGTPGASRELDDVAAKHEVIERVVGMQWASLEAGKPKEHTSQPLTSPASETPPIETSESTPVPPAPTPGETPAATESSDMPTNPEASESTDDTKHSRHNRRR